MKTFTKYLLLQIPGWVGVGFILLLLREGIALPLWGAGLLLLLWILKDLLLFPLVRRAYEPRGKGGEERLIGRKGTVQIPLTPVGYVQIGGELWRAEVPDYEKPVAKGRVVRVRAVRGLTLLVEPEGEGNRVNDRGLK